ncbi:MAG TPA: PIN domain-containing protein [Blastocatellia bacterium]|nr:PIN domain-containing protein [Blastocatellia bacterium]
MNSVRNGIIARDETRPSAGGRDQTGIRHLASNLLHLINAANFQTLPIDIKTATSAADLRARYNLRTPDALRVATALAAGCDAFLTNDSDMQRVSELRVLVLDQLEL